jgi:hypothetical protein
MGADRGARASGLRRRLYTLIVGSVIACRTPGEAWAGESAEVAGAEELCALA